MNDVFASALWITLIGMSLVFVAILLLWGLMEGLMRLTAERKAARPGASLPESGSVGEASLPEQMDTLKRRAAAAAVAAALALQKGKSGGVDHLPPTGRASAWQAVMRSLQLNQRGQSFSRKSRGKS